MYTKKSNICNGLGVFTSRKFSKHEILFYINFELISVSSIKNFDNYWPFDDLHAAEFLPGLIDNVQDIVIFNNKRRSLRDIFFGDKPLFELVEKLCVNAVVCRNPKNRTFFLVAVEDIDSDQEIIIHRGMKYWLNRELLKGYLYDPQLLILDGYCYENIVSYCDRAYPRYSRIRITKDTESGTIDIILLNEEDQIIDSGSINLGVKTIKH